MLNRGTAVAIAILAGGCASAEVQSPPSQLTAAVSARAETVPVGTADADAADDPAIWRNARRPQDSLIVATDKKAGLYVYGLDGKVRHFNGAGRLNNVDLLDLGPRGILVAASDRNDPANAKLKLFRLDPRSAALVPLGDVIGGAGEAYGICLWRHAGAIYAFSVLKEGAVHQVRIDLAGAQPTGMIVRTLKLSTQPEGCVVDPRSGRLFVGEEDRGIWSFDARPDTPSTGSLVAPVDGRHLVADVEGLAINPAGRTGGYLIASSQGDNSYALYALPTMAPAGRFKIAAGQIGAAEETDGIAFHPGSFGASYPSGLFIAQDGINAPGAQNFKLVSWAEVRRTLGR